LRRLVEGRGEDPEEVEERLKAQMPEEEQARWADVVIDNGGTPQQTREQVKAEWSKIEERLLPSRVIVRRASREDLGPIAEVVRKASGGRSASDQGTLLERLYEWAYFVSATSKIMGVVRWQATNLVASLKDLYVYPPTQRRRMGAPLLERVEQEAKTLACEVALLCADRHSSWRAVKFYRSLGYERANPKGVPKAWREVMEEQQDAGEMVLLKRLR
jgi:N-acetylglutamate synthase-like GNAT family acetyltransferase